MFIYFTISSPQTACDEDYSRFVESADREDFDNLLREGFWPWAYHDSETETACADV
jgi:hypothetical protein